MATPPCLMLAGANLVDRLIDLPAQLVEAYATAEPRGDVDDAPPRLAEAFGQLAATLTQLDRADAPVAGQSPAETATELGEYGLNLCRAALDWVRQLHAEPLVEPFRTLVLDLALWVADRGGWLLTLEPVVDALAGLANRTQETACLERLFDTAGRVRAAVVPALRRDLEKTDPGRPWRLLTINRAIIATRTHHPELMETAFRDLVDDFPQDAPAFFTQGMEQMDLLNYPTPVREVMEKYYEAWSTKRALH